MTTSDITTIQVSIRNRDALLVLGEMMQARSPHIWSKTPSFNATIGYALTHLTADFDVDELLPIGGDE